MRYTLRAAALAVIWAGCDPLLGGRPPADQTLDLPTPGLEPAQLAAFVAGDQAFSDAFSAARGLGPVFNAGACNACHTSEGRGHPARNLIRFGRGDSSDAARFDYLIDRGGPQLQDHAVPGYLAEALPADVPGLALSIRSGPAVAGLGLIEAIPDEALLGLADPDDRDGNGVRGRPNYVPVPDFLPAPAGCVCAGCQLAGGVCLRLARFGRKATALDLLQQTVGAYHQDMGLTTDQHPRDVYNPALGGPSGDAAPDPEVPAGTVQDVVFYLRTLRPPPRRGADQPPVQRGQGVFQRLGCAACHVPELTTGDSSIAVLSRRPVPLYADLLLHDLGDGLADGYPEGQATGREWRTTPLWGLGLVGALLGGAEHYLHDGRAGTLREAILWHGGEAQAARDRFAALPAADAADLDAFLRSL